MQAIQQRTTRSIRGLALLIAALVAAMAVGAGVGYWAKSRTTTAVSAPSVTVVAPGASIGRSLEHRGDIQPAVGGVGQSLEHRGDTQSASGVGQSLEHRDGSAPAPAPSVRTLRAS